MSSINGCGRRFYGKRAFKSDGSYITTRWLTIVYFPISPSHSARVKKHASGGPMYEELEIVEELPLCLPQVFLTYLYVYGLLLGTAFYADKHHWSNAAQIFVIAMIAAIPFVSRMFSKPIKTR